MNVYYTYHITAVNQVVESDPSDPITMKAQRLPPPATNVQVNLGEGYVNVTWTPPEDMSNVKGYMVERCPAGGGSVVSEMVYAPSTYYHDSDGRWTVDSQLDAIQAAAGAASYSLFDFYLPDWTPAADATQRWKMRDHEREPGALLFRKLDVLSGRKPELLLVLLAPETATSGLHVGPFKTAVGFARFWGQPSPAEAACPATDGRRLGDRPPAEPALRVKIVGPVYSGSTLSMRMALEDLACGAEEEAACPKDAPVLVVKPGVGFNQKSTFTTRESLRPRRLRLPALRRMVRETTLAPDDFIYPLFVTHGLQVCNEIGSMPGVYQWSIDRLAREAESIAGLEIPAVILFGLPAQKDPVGLENFAADGIVQQAIREIKRAVPELIVITDVCLCELPITATAES